ncbi:sulfite exporter TauE/SafE family protein [Pulveribacter sp.]|uniref:sulfite exporter TauE/SafE family protein n=1 Tax=Pulveribacter sp. TaxID=2678893 RepID=UPI0028B0644A|nr:sulfite exporter TauE/SafE family protein [Pulveribacter sp.]
MDLTAYAQMALLAAVASFCQNLTGFAFALIFVGAAGALSLMPIQDAANVASVLSAVNGLVYLRSHPAAPRWDLLRPMVVSGVAGVGLGLALLAWLSGNTLHGLRVVLGLSIVACALLLLARSQPRATPSSPRVLWGVGLVSGVLGGLFSTAGPPIVYHLYRQPLPPMLVRQCLVALFTVLALVRLGAVAAAGALPWHTLAASAVALPVVTGVTWWQARHPLHLPVALVRWLVCALLLAAGGSLLASAW